MVELGVITHSGECLQVGANFVRRWRGYWRDRAASWALRYVHLLPIDHLEYQMHTWSVVDNPIPAWDLLLPPPGSVLYLTPVMRPLPPPPQSPSHHLDLLQDICQTPWQSII